MMKNIWAFVGVLVLILAVIFFIKLTPREATVPVSENPEPQISQELETEEEGAGQGKLDINVICENALASRTFENGEAAAQFVADCKEGKYPEVIEEFKVQMNITDDQAI